MSNDDRIARVLGMVAAGTITVGEGQELLDALADVPRASAGEAMPARKLVISVADNGQMVAESAVPLTLYYADRQFLPRQVRHYLNKFEVDLDGLLARAQDLGLTGTLSDLRQDQVNLWISLK